MSDNESYQAGWDAALEAAEKALVEGDDKNFMKLFVARRFKDLKEAE